LECVHESAGLTPNMENSDILECAGKIMLECTEITPECNPIWIFRAVFGQLQVVQAKLLESVTHSMMFQEQKAEEVIKGKEPTPEELEIDVAFEAEVTEKIQTHLYGFFMQYLLFKEAASILYGHFVGPLVVTIELAVCPSLQSIVLSHAEQINKIQAQVGIDVYRKYKASLSMDRFKKDHGKKGAQKKLCKNFLFDKCDKGDKCPLTHDQALKTQLV